MIPKHDLALEEAVLGACMLEGDILEQLAAELDPKIFYKPAHAMICNAIKEMSIANQQVDILTVSNHLASSKKLEACGGAHYISQLSHRVASTANAEYHFRILQQHFISRQLLSIGLGMHARVEAVDADPFDILAEVIGEMEALTSGFMAGAFKHVSKIHSDNLVRIRDMQNPDNRPVGVPTFFNTIQQATGGWQPGDLIILAARPSMGKTALAIKWAMEPAIKHNIPTAIFSLEMSETPIASRMESILSEVPADKIYQGKLTPYEIQSIEAKCKALNTAPIYVDATSTLNIQQLKQKARKAVKEKGVQMIVIDYLQLMSGMATKAGQNREQEISSISRGLKQLAKELKIPVIALSQLSRDCEKRPNKRPMLSDLRESGAIEQDGDVIIFLYRASYYKEETIFVDGRDIDSTGKGEIIIAKNRNGSLAHAVVDYIASNTNFKDNF